MPPVSTSGGSGAPLSSARSAALPPCPRWEEQNCPCCEPGLWAARHAGKLATLICPGICINEGGKYYFFFLTIKRGFHGVSFLFIFSVIYM